MICWNKVPQKYSTLYRSL